MRDGLEEQNLKVGTVVASTILSGADLAVASSKIGVAEVSTDVFQAGSNTLSSGSRWVTFGTAFSNANYHVACSANAAIAALPYSVIGTGSKAVGSFIALGSPAGVAFDWIAVARK